MTCGTVWIAHYYEIQDFYEFEDIEQASATARWVGYWDRGGVGGEQAHEQMPDLIELRDALAWARERSSKIWLRIDDDEGYLWSGEGRCPSGSGRVLSATDSRLEVSDARVIGASLLERHLRGRKY